MGSFGHDRCNYSLAAAGCRKGEIMADSIKYRRVLLKLSGEALAGDKKTGLDYSVIAPICTSIKRCWEAGVQMGIVVGGGNFWRGRSSGAMDRTRADHIGMLATTMNSLAVADGHGVSVYWIFV